MSSSNSNLPIDIMIDILSRLPVKSLVRFTSVSRNWYALIKSPSFIAQHLNQSAHGTNKCLLAKICNYRTQNRGMSLLFNHTLDESVNLDFPFLNKKSDFCIVGGSSNGLACINLSPGGFRLILCNPGTRQFRQLPICKLKYPNYQLPCYWDFHIDRVCLGFGFHPKANDYKIVRIVYYFGWFDNYIVRAEVYATSTDSWREINDVVLPSFFDEEKDDDGDDIPCDISGSSVVLRGVIYWGAYILPENDLIIVSFDMDDEAFREVEMPLGLDEVVWDEISWKLTNLKDELALIICSEHQLFDVWVMDKYDRSWTKKFTVGCEENGEIMVVGCGRSGEILLEYRTYIKHLLYDIDTNNNKIKVLPIPRDLVLSKVCAYIESLVPVKTQERP